MEEEFDFLRPNKVYFLDTNLSSPVLDVEIQQTHQLLKNHRHLILKEKAAEHLNRYTLTELSFFRKLCKKRGWKSIDLIATTQLSPELYKLLESEMLISPEGFKSHYDEAKVIAEVIQKAVMDGMESRGMPVDGISGTAENLGSKISAPYRIAYEEFCNFYGRAESRTKDSEHIWTLGSVGNVKYWISSRYALVELCGVLYHSSPNQVLMFKDKLATRYMMLEHVSPLRLGSQLPSYLLELFSWQDDTLVIYGNQAYELLKSVEPIFKTRLSHITDDVFGEDTAYNRMQVKLMEKEVKLARQRGIPPASMTRLFHLVESVPSLADLVELFGCQKSCGHPIIDPRAGGLSAAEEARTRDTTSYKDSQDLRNVFCHIVLTSFIEKEGRWPPLKYLKRGTKLEVLNVRQERDISYRTYPLHEWNHVEWGKIFEMDYFPNFLELMDDKAISFYRSQKHLTWDEGTTSSQRRLLLEVLRRKEINIKEIVDRVSARDIPFEWLIISLYPKEREFKVDPRMFAMMVLEMRCFFTCIEANVADHLFKYMPQQTMTKTKTQIQERFLTFTDPSKDPNQHTLFLEIDLSRWNLRWREMTIHMLGHDLNNMFGVKGTFTVTHWFFARCQMMVRVAGLRPEGIEKKFPPISSLAWTEHYGGLEGINQKVWTAATYAMIEKALIPVLLTGKITKYELIGQGDNQVLRIAVPTSDDRTRADILRDVRDDVNQRLEATCASVNQKVKPEENIESTTVLTYSKDVYIRGVEYPTTLKKHSRLFPVTSSDFPSTTANAAAIMAGAVAGSENSRHSLCSAVVGWYHTARYLLAASDGFSIHGRYGAKMSTQQIIAALILPPSIGGMIGTPIASFMYKGGSDPLGKEISSLRLLAVSDTVPGIIAGRALRALEQKYCFSTEQNLEILIDNPYGLPLDKSTSPLGQVSHLTLEAFRGKVLNRDIRPLLDRSVLSSESKLKTDILAIRPLNPILAHDLFDASGFGTIKEMRKMFLNTRTVQSIAQWVNPNITHNFLRADVNDIIWFCNWFKGLPKLSYSGADSYTIVKNARASWGVDLHGVTNYQPLDSYHLAGSTRNQSSIKWSARSGVDLLYVRGPLSGYLGTATKDKRSEHGYKIVDAGAPSRAMMKLQLIRSQANGNVNFNELIDRIGLTRTNCKLSLITDILPKIVGGSLAHKHKSTIREMAAAYVGPLNFVTHIRLDTDSLGKVSGGSDNYSVMTQEYMVLAIFVAKLLYYHTNTISGEMIVDTDIMEPIPEDSLVAPEPQFETASLPRTKLLYTPELSLRRTYDNTARVVPRGSVVGVADYSDAEVIANGFVGFFCDLLRDHSRAKVLADTRGLSALPAKLQIDIAEAHAVGPRKLASYMAEAIWISNLRDTFRTLHLHPERWDEALYLTHNISTCVRSVSNYFRHPLCFSHPDYDSLRGSGLRYGGSFSPQKRMEALVKRDIVRIYRYKNHPFWNKPVPVFQSENSMNLTESVSVSAIKRLYVLYLTGDPQARKFSSLLASFTRLTSDKTATPEAQLELLRVRLTQLSRIYYKMGDPLLSSEMLKASNLKYIAVHNDDAKTVMRFARNLATIQGIARPRILRTHGIPPLDDYDACPECLPAASSKHHTIWRKNSVRPNGGHVSAGYTWVPLLGSMRVMKHVAIVGSGNGGLADLLLTSFDCEVVGLDLESDMPREAATLLNYLPVGVSQTNSQAYTQSDLSISTSGDWTDPEVRTSFLNDLVAKTTLFVDITTEGLDHCTLILSSSDHEMVDTVYTRVISSEHNIESLYSQLKDKGSVRFWVLSRSYQNIEAVFEFRTLPNQFLHNCKDKTWITDLVSDDMHALIPVRKNELVESATLSVIAPDNPTSLLEVHQEVESLCQSLLNKTRHRQLLYKDRMSLIWACITMSAAVSENPPSLIQEWISDGFAETDLFRYPMRESLVTHLLRYVPRLRTMFPIG